MFIEWNLTPTQDVLNERGDVKIRTWLTQCGRLKLSETTRSGRRVAVAEFLSEDGKYCECDPVHVGATTPRHYNTLREAAEAAERCLAGDHKLITNREDMLAVASAWPEVPPDLSSGEEGDTPRTGQEDEMTTALENGVFEVTESDARKLMHALGADATGSNNKRDRLEKKLNDLPRWAGSLPEPEGEMLDLFRAIGRAVEDGDEIVVVADGDDSEGESEEVTSAKPAKKPAKKEAKPKDKPEKKPAKKPKAKDGPEEPSEEAEADEPPADEEVYEQTDAPWKLVSKTLKKLTPALVNEFHAMPVFPRDRAVKKVILSTLREAFRTGQYRGGEYASVKVKETGETYRVNGKHTGFVCTEWLEKGRPLPPVQMTVSHFECDTMEQAADLYQTFDPAKSARAKGDLIRAYASATEELSQCKDALLKLCTPAIAYAEWGSNFKNHSTQEQTHLMIENASFVRWVKDIMDTKKEGQHLWRAPVVSAMLRTWCAGPEAATTFWEAVRDGTEDKKSPEYKLKKWLETHKFGASQKTEEGVGRAEDREGVYHCVCAWNAFRDAANKYPPAKPYNSDIGIPDAV